MVGVFEAFKTAKVSLNGLLEEVQAYHSGGYFVTAFTSGAGEDFCSDYQPQYQLFFSAHGTLFSPRVPLWQAVSVNYSGGFLHHLVITHDPAS